jgi:RNA polymerase sigma-54 factor
MMRLGVGTTTRQVQRLTLTPALRAALDLLRMDARDLSQHIAQAADRNPWIEVRRWPAAGGAGLPVDAADQVEAAGPSLSAHVAGWIDAQFPAGPRRRIALALADALEPSGWLGARLDQIRRETGCSAAEAEAVLAEVQRIEPRGLFARSLAECLRLQADEAGVLDGVMQAVLDRLDLVARGDVAALARLARCEPAAVRQRIDALRGMDPKPGSRFSVERLPPVPPELEAQRGPTGWQVLPAQGALPEVALRAEAPAGDADVAAARALIAMLDRRGQLLVRIGSEMVLRQARAMETGTAAMRPLTRGAVAAALGLHESTVSRATAGLRIRTPHGVLRAAAFFPAGLADGAVSSAAVKAALRALVEAEDASAPLSDAALGAALAGRGLPAARRTVAKYREAMGIAPACRRRRGPAAGAP